MRLITRLRGGARDVLSVNDYLAAASAMNYAGGSYPLGGMTQTIAGTQVERMEATYPGFASAMRNNPIIFACMLNRSQAFSAVRFRWQNISDGKPSKMFGNADLDILEHPWPGGTTQDLLTQIITDVDLTGNAFLTRVNGEIICMRPDWMQIAAFPRTYRGGQLGWERVGFYYTEGGPESGNDGVALLPNEVAHFAPIPDPMATFRGMSWLTPVVREIIADGMMTAHKAKYFENGATPNMVIKHEQTATQEKIMDFARKLNAVHGGVGNAYKTLHLYPGADATVVGNNFQQVDFKSVQSAGETRIAAAAGVPPVIIGLSEGLSAATYSNYSQARRRFGDGTVHPLWQNVAGSLETLMTVPPGTNRLWYDASDVPFLREDEMDAAAIAQSHAATIRMLLDAGFTPDSVVYAVESGDFLGLVHTGLFSVQLQAPGANQAATPPTTQGTTP